MIGSEPSSRVRSRGIETTPPSDSAWPAFSVPVHRVPHAEARAADEDPVAPKRAPRDSLSPQRGEGRGEGWDNLRRTNGPASLRLDRGGARDEGRRARCEAPFLPRPSSLVPGPSFDSSPRPSPRSRRRGSAGGSRSGIRLPAALVGARPISANQPPSGNGRRSDVVETALTRWDFLPDWMTAPLSPGERVGVRGNNAPGINARRTTPVEFREFSARAGDSPR